MSSKSNKFMTMGKHSYYAEPPTLRYSEKHRVNNSCHTYIGKYSCIGRQVVMITGCYHRLDWITSYPFGHIKQNEFPKFNGKGHPTSNGDIVIGNDVWIADNVTIMSGVHIGDGAVIAANSHVVKNVEPYSIMGGNPARVIRYKFDEETIESLLSIKWWDWEDEKVNYYSPKLCNSNISDFIESVYNNHYEIEKERKEIKSV